MKERIYLVQVAETGDLYGWTQDKKLANRFVSLRKDGYFEICVKKFDSDPVSQFKLGRFRNMYRDLMIFENVLGGTSETIYFPTTTEENYHIQKKCDTIFDDLINVSREICAYPLTDKVRDAMEYLSWYATCDGGKNIYCDTFLIFMELYGHTVI